MEQETGLSETTSTSKEEDVLQNPVSTVVNNVSKPDEVEEEETRVITLDTIIRKGLIEKMPMTAKDVNSIVSKSLQKERERQAADKLRLAALQARQMDSDNDTESTEYDSSNEQEISVDSVKNQSFPIDKPTTLESRKEFEIEPISVIQRVPKDSRSQMYLADDLKNTQEDPEDFELKSGDLHYSESNPSDYSESENRQSSSQNSSKKRQTLSRKRELSPVAGRSMSAKETVDLNKKKRLDFVASCTDSKRNAILLQCSTGFGDSTKRPSPKLSLLDDLTSKSISPSSQYEALNDNSEDRSIDIESMLQVQHCMDEESSSNLQKEANIHKMSAEDEPVVVIKQERESPVEDMLVIHHIEEFEPNPPPAGRGSKKAKPKSNFNRSTYSDKRTPTKSIKRIKKSLGVGERNYVDKNEDQSVIPIIQSVCTTNPSPKQLESKKRQIQKRDKRHSVRSNPIYAELSESSSDHIDVSLASKNTSNANSSKSGSALPATGTPKIHWKTQLKMQRQKSEVETKLTPDPTDHLSTTKEDAMEEDKNNAKETESFEDDSVLEDGTAVNRIIEPPHNQKRIPKLKYGSFNFTERRGVLAKGPKMVLKYKKKYKKKTKLRSLSVAAEPTIAVDETSKELDSLKIQPKKIVAGVKKSSKTQGQLEESDLTTKTVHTVKLPKSDRPAISGRSLKDQNRVLLDILDQRSCEIRNLKIRISNIMRTKPNEITFDPTKTTHSAPKSLRDVPLKTEPNTEPKTPDWSLDELIQSFCLQKRNRTLYAHMQQRYSLPLALPSEIDAFVAKLSFERGHLLNNILKVLQYDGEHMSELERVTVLQISQIPIKPSYSYVEKSDSIHHSTSDRLFVILARGLVGAWQQPIYINSSADNLTQVVKLAITKLNDIQFNVIACCSRFEDDDTNKMWTDLGASRGYSYFSHSITNDPIYTFYYVDDILRSVHQHLMSETGFQTDMGAKINREPIDALLQKCANLTDLVNSLNEPTTFFTQKTSDLLRILKPDNYDTCSEFVDVFAAYQHMARTEDYGGEHLEQQVQVLSHVQLQLYKLKFRQSTAIPEFKQAITHSIESLKLLQHSMRQKYNVDSFPARSVSEDYLRLIAKVPLYWETAVSTIQNISFPQISVAAAKSINLTISERSHVQTIIDEIAQNYNLADKSKFVQDLWRIEDKFMTLWDPLFTGNVHVLRDTLGKVKPSTSLEGSVAFVRKRIELRLSLINALDGVAEWAKHKVVE